MAGHVLEAFSAQRQPIPPDEQHVHGGNLIIGGLANGANTPLMAVRSPSSSKYSRGRIAPAQTVIGWSVKAKRIFGESGDAAG